MISEKSLRAAIEAYTEAKCDDAFNACNPFVPTEGEQRVINENIMRTTIDLDEIIRQLYAKE